MPGNKRFIECAMPSVEIETLRELSNRRWERFWVQGGTFKRKCEEAPTAYAVKTLVVEAGETFIVWAHSDDLPDRTEVFRIAVDRRRLDYFRIDRPPLQPLRNDPEDLGMTAFLGRKNSVRLVKRIESRSAESVLAGCQILIDWGLIWENDVGAMAIFATDYDPLDICITTNKAAIATLLDEASEIVELA